MVEMWKVVRGESISVWVGRLYYCAADKFIPFPIKVDTILRSPCRSTAKLPGSIIPMI